MCHQETKSNIDMAELRDLFISRARERLLQVFFSSPQKIFYVRELVRLTGEQINAVRRELKRMEIKKMVRKEERGNRLYYSFRKDYLFYDDLLALVGKTTGLGGEIVRNQNKIGNIRFAMLSGRFLKNLPRKKNEVDLLIVGQVVLPQIASLVRAEEAKRKREINYTVMTEKELDFRKHRRDSFILGVLSSSRVMLIGDEEKMIEGIS